MPRKPKFCKDDILNAGLKLLREHGWRGLTPAALAKTLNASTMPIYSYFKNMSELKEELLGQIWQIIEEYIATKKTGDIWIDQAYGYVQFARDERELFICANDGSLPELQRIYFDKFVDTLGAQLEHYPPFQSIPHEIALKIRFSRSLLSHGMASMISANLSRIEDDDDGIIEKLKMTSYALYDGVLSNSEYDSDNNKGIKKILEKQNV